MHERRSSGLDAISLALGCCGIRGLIPTYAQKIAPATDIIGIEKAHLVASGQTTIRLGRIGAVYVYWCTKSLPFGT